MANNKMQIYCTDCHEAVAIAKYYPGDWTINNDNLVAELNIFFSEHLARCFKKIDRSRLMWGENMFGFRTENDDDGFQTAFDPFRIVKIKN